MSLKAFHLFFIAMSVILAAFTAAWATGQYRTFHELNDLLMVVVSVALGVGLAFYGVRFQRKVRQL
jgi:phosphate/sulfate permease